MFAVGQHVKGQVNALLDGIANRIQAPIPDPLQCHFLPIFSDGQCRFGFCFVVKGHRYKGDRCFNIDIVLAEHVVHFIWFQLFVCMIRNRFDSITDIFTHRHWHDNTVILLEQIADTAFPRLGVDANDIAFIFPSNVFWIDRQIWHRPVAAILFLTPFHPFGNRILVRAGECRKDQFPCIWLTVIDTHAGDLFVHRNGFWHIGQIQLWIHPLGEEVHRHGDQVDVAGAFPIAKQRPLNAVRPCKQTQFRIRYRTAAVVVWVQGNHDMFTVDEVFTHIFHLTCINVWHRVRDRCRQIDDDFVVRRRFPNFQDTITDFQCKFHFSTGKALRRILEAEVSFIFCGTLFDIFCPEFRNGNDFFFGFSKHLLPLCKGGGVVQMHHGIFCPTQCFKGLFDDVLSRLGQYLYCHVVRNQVFFNQGAQKVELCFRSCRKAYFNFFEADFNQKFEKFYLFFQAHRHDQRLIAVTQVDTTPLWCFVQIFFCGPVQADLRWHKILSFVIFKMFHHCTRSFLKVLYWGFRDNKKTLVSAQC